MIKRLLAPLALLAVLLIWPATVLAATYGSGTYGNCPYSEGCAPPEELPPPTETPPEEPGKVSRDIDSDGEDEIVNDANGDESDGFESFVDPDGSSEVLKSIDGDGDGKTDFIINTDEDEFPERYWDPDDDILSTIQLTQCDNDDTLEWRFDVGPETRTYDPDTDTFLESCEAPSQPNSNPGSTGPAGRGNNRVNETRITNVLPFLSENPLYESIGRAVKKVPAPVAHSFPYLLLFLILLLVLRLIIQSRQEVNRLLIAKNAQEAEKRLSLEKSNFMMLSSHYLRTPITVIRGNIELMQSLKQITDEVGKTLNSAGQLLLDQVSYLLNRLENDKELAVIQPTGGTMNVKTYISPLLVLPVVLVLVFLLIGQFLLIDFRVVSPNIVNLLVQILLAALLVQTFLSKVRQRQLNRHNREDQERILSEQRALDAARADFITGVANSLEEQLNQFKQQLGPVIGQPSAIKLKNALSQLASIVAKFRLVAFLQGQQLQDGKVNFRMRDVIDESLQPYIQPAQFRGISIDDKVEDGQLQQQRQLISIVLKSLMDNALKYSTDGSMIEVSAKTNHGMAVIEVSDNGPGIPKDKQDLLFKPFSRTDSAETFDSEGLGFSLYLDRVIANYLQGDISVNSTEGKGTTVTLQVPATA